MKLIIKIENYNDNLKLEQIKSLLNNSDEIIVENLNQFKNWHILKEKVDKKDRKIFIKDRNIYGKINDKIFKSLKENLIEVIFSSPKGDVGAIEGKIQ